MEERLTKDPEVSVELRPLHMPVELLTCVSTHMNTRKHTLAHHSHTTAKEGKEENDLKNSKHPEEP